MNEQLQKALAELIGKASNGIDASVSFLSAEIPEVIHQLLVWYAAKSAILTVAGILVCVGWFFMEKAILRKLRSEEVEFFEIAMFYGLLGSFVRLIPASLACTLISLDWLQIWIAPKIWLIEYASRLAK